MNGRAQPRIIDDAITWLNVAMQGAPAEEQYWETGPRLDRNSVGDPAHRSCGWLQPEEAVARTVTKPPTFTPFAAWLETLSARPPAPNQFKQTWSRGCGNGLTNTAFDSRGPDLGRKNGHRKAP